VHARQCTYRVRALSGGDDVTGRQPGCGRDFARKEHRSRGLKGAWQSAWQLLNIVVCGQSVNNFWGYKYLYVILGFAHGYDDALFNERRTASP